MPFRCVCIVSVSNGSLLYVRRFANNDNKAVKAGAQPIDFEHEKQFVNSLLTSLSIETNIDVNGTEFDCMASNQLPVIHLNTSQSRIWPVIVVETDGYLITGFPLCTRNSDQLIDHDSIALCFTALQLIANQIRDQKGLSWIEWFITSVMPFGTLISYNYRPFVEQLKRDNKQINENVIKIIIKELMSANKEKEILYGTISVDNSLVNNTKLNTIEKQIVSFNVKNIESLSLVLPQNCSVYGSNIDLSLTKWKNPLSLIHYKCNLKSTNREKLLNYNYNITKIANKINYYRINLSIYLNTTGRQVMFKYFNVHFKYVSENLKSTLSFIHPITSCGQLVQENGFFWVIGSKFPKSGHVNLSFDLICNSSKISELETKCNFNIQNVHTNQFFSEYEHLRIADIKLVPNEFHLNIESSITSVDYKLIPNNVNELNAQ